jgi:hypothetical protein
METLGRLTRRARRTVKAAGGLAPKIRPPPHPADQAAHDFQSAMATVSPSPACRNLKRDCLDKDGDRCVLTGLHDVRRTPPTAGAWRVHTRRAHILPPSLGRLGKRSTKKPSGKKMSANKRPATKVSPSVLRGRLSVRPETLTVGHLPPRPGTTPGLGGHFTDTSHTRQTRSMWALSTTRRTPCP